MSEVSLVTAQESLYQAQDAYDQGDFLTVCKIISSLPVEQSESEWGLELLTSARECLGLYVSSIKTAERWLELYPESVAAHLHLGYTFLSFKNYEYAVTEFDKVLVKRPHDSYALDNKIYAFSSLGRWDEASKTFHERYDPVPDDAQTLIRLASITRGQACSAARTFQIAKMTDLCSKVLEYTTRAYELEPDNPLVVSWHSFAFSTFGQNSEALKVCEKFVESNEPTFEIKQRVGGCYVFANRPMKAIEYLRPAYEADPSDKWTRKNLALAYIMIGQFGRALKVGRGK